MEDEIEKKYLEAKARFSAACKELHAARKAYRNSLGVCVMCGKTAEFASKERKLCANCLEKTKVHAQSSLKSRKKSYETRKILGLCIACGKELDSKGTLCPSCRKKKYEAQKKRLEYRRANRLCVTCGKPLPEDMPACKKGTGRNCPECQARRKEWQEAKRKGQ